MFRTTDSSLTAFNKSFSRKVTSLSLKNTAMAVFAAFPLVLVPGVNFTLNLKLKKKKKICAISEVLKNKRNILTYNLI